MEKMNTCKNCGNQFTGKYCNVCGEKVYTDHDKSIPHFFEDAFHFITHFEGTFFNTLKAVLFKPGKLSLEYCSGLRKKYFRPLSFFMLLVILYLIFPFFTGLNMPFRFYLNKGSLPSKMVSKKTGIDIDSIYRKIDTMYLSIQDINPQMADNIAFSYGDSVLRNTPALKKVETSFTRKSEKTSKILLLILIPLLTLPLVLLSIRRKKVLYDQLVLSTEINSFFLLFSFFIIPGFVLLFHSIAPGVAASVLSDFSVSLLGYSVLGIFCSVAFRRFYKDPWWWAIPKAAVVTIAHYYIVGLIYKIVLFAVTLYMS